MPAGRPPKYETPEKMQRIIDLYFLACRARKEDDTTLLAGLDDEDLLFADSIEDSVPTVSGLAYILEMTTETLRMYGNDDEFSATVKKAKQRVEISLENRLAGNSVTGAIFNLKNNFGWKDKTESNVNLNAAGAFLEAIKPSKGLPSDRDK